MLRHGTAATAGAYTGSDNLTRVRELRLDRHASRWDRPGITVSGPAQGPEFLLFVPDSLPPLPQSLVDALASLCARDSAGFAGIAWVDASVMHPPAAAPADLPVSTQLPGPAAVPVPVGPLMVDATRFDMIGGFAADFDPFHQDADFCLRLHRLGFGCEIVPATDVFLPDSVHPAPAPPRFQRLWSSYVAALRPPTTLAGGSS